MNTETAKAPTELTTAELEALLKNRKASDRSNFVHPQIRDKSLP